MRQNGYYWVFFNEWEIAYYENKKGWLCVGVSGNIDDSFFIKIDERAITREQFEKGFEAIRITEALKAAQKAYPQVPLNYKHGYQPNGKINTSNPPRQ